MYRYIEQPFRTRKLASETAIQSRNFVKLFAGLSACLVGVSALIWTNEGWPGRFPANLAQLAREAETERGARFIPYRERCLEPNATSCDEATEGVNVAVIGDSHAPDAFNTLVSQYPSYHYMLHGLAGCPHLVKEDFDLLTAKHPNRNDCISRNEELLYGSRLSNANLIIINTVFAWYRPEHLKRSIMQLQKQTTAPIVVLGNYLFFSEEVPDMVVVHGSTAMDKFYEDKLEWHSLAFESELKSLSSRIGFTYISKRRLFCGGESISDYPLIFGTKLFTYDRHHLRLAAAQEMGILLKNHYNQLFAGIKTPAVSGGNLETVN